MPRLVPPLAKFFGIFLGCTLLSGCTFSLWDTPAPEPVATAAEDDRDRAGNVLIGLFTRTPADLPNAVAVPALQTAAVERGFGGVILRVTGIAPTQGFHDATLIAEDDGTPDAAGVLTVSLFAIPPLAPQAVGPERTRLLMTAVFLTDRELRDIRGFRVVAGQNSVTLPLR